MTNDLTAMSPAEPCQVEFADRGTHLLAHAMGEFPLSSLIIELWGKIAHECARTGHHRLLYVDGFQNKATLEAIQELVDSPVLDLLRNTTIAVISKGNRLETEFGVYLAQQKGINVRFFHALDDASEWLSSA